MASDSDGLEPAPVATELAASIIDDDDLQRKLLRDTVDTGDGATLEAGRTFCGTDDEDGREPRDRGERSVELETCPVDEPTAIVHTHPSEAELRNPQHSLPDLANVAFEDVDASVVVGAETSSVVYRATDPQAQREVFRNALGLPVESAGDVVAAFENGQIDDPTLARRRVVDAFGSLVDTARTEHVDVLDDEPEMVAAAESLVMYSAFEFPDPTEFFEASDTERHPTQQQRLRGVDSLRQSARAGAAIGEAAIPNERVKQTAVGTVVGMLTSRAVERLL